MTTTTKLRTPRARFDGLPVPVAIAICVFSLIATAFLVGKIRSAPAAAAQPTPALVIVYATPQPPTPAAVVAMQLPRFVVCYDQPVNGAVLGPIPAPDTSAIVARYGVAWVMTPWNGGYCWLRAADVGMPDVADLEPPPAPVVVYQPVYQPAYAAPTPEPRYEVTNSEPPPVVAPQQMVILDREQWALDAQRAAGR